MKGFSEVDDVMHNTVGCLIGFLIVSGFRHITIAVSHLPLIYKRDRGTGSASRGYKYPRYRYAESDRGLNQSVAAAA